MYKLEEKMLTDKNNCPWTTVVLKSFKTRKVFSFILIKGRRSAMYCLYDTHSFEAFNENRYQFKGVHFELVIDVLCSPKLFLMHSLLDKVREIRNATHSFRSGKISSPLCCVQRVSIPRKTCLVK
jgi:hypothetical protein